MNDLPEFYHADDGQRVAKPTYEALMQCQILMTSAETGLTGPTVVQPGEHFTTDAVPNHQWLPLNRAAGERYEHWFASLPPDGKGLTQADITEAAYAMRPREGETEMPHEVWWPAVLKYAVTMKEKRQGNAQMGVRPAVGQRPSTPQMPVMPFAATGQAMPLDAGRPPAGAEHQPQSQANAAQRARRARVTSPMPGTLPSESPQQATG